jgi:hypothetical protein
MLMLGHASPHPVVNNGLGTGIFSSWSELEQTDPLGGLKWDNLRRSQELVLLRRVSQQKKFATQPPCSMI